VRWETSGWSGSEGDKQGDCGGFAPVLSMSGEKGCNGAEELRAEGMARRARARHLHLNLAGPG
jgi:hypothetical protein